MKMMSWSKRCLVYVAAGVAGLVPPSVLAQGTPAQQQACTPDVFRLCSSFIPDVPSITACLKQRRDDLSEECREAVFPPLGPDEARTRSGLRAQPER